MRGDGGPPSLIDARGMGGVFAQGGFDYQLWYGLLRLPAWLANPGFEEMIFEGLEDLEARFFAPHAPRHRLLERFQAKSGDLSPATVRGVLESFRDFETKYPQAARVQTLVISRLPSKLSWLSRDPARVRNARPFYAPFPDVASASDEQLRKRLVSEFGEDVGGYVAGSVEVHERNLPDRDAAVSSFGGEIERAFSTDSSHRCIRAAFERLETLSRRSNGIPLGRAQLVAAIKDGLGRPLPFPAAFPLHVRSDRNEANPAALEIDASGFSGVRTPFPPPETWARDLAAPLDRTACWLRSHGFTRVALDGSYRLTTAMILGWSLRSAVGFELDVPTRDGAWRTDSRPAPGYTAPEWHVRRPATLHHDQLVVALGILRDPSETLWETAGVPIDRVLRLHLPEPIVSAQMAQASASVVKRAVDDAVARFHPRGLHLYMASPAAFAVVLGHRWNALPRTQLHEFLPAEARYVKTAVI